MSDLAAKARELHWKLAAVRGYGARPASVAPSLDMHFQEGACEGCALLEAALREVAGDQ